MTRVVLGIAVGLMALAGAGCGGNPLVGRWTRTETNAGATSTTTLSLNGDGSAAVDVAGSGSCSGNLTFTGFTWTSAMTTITFSGTGACSGMITCTAGGSNFTLNCSNSMNTMRNGACTYMLSNSNMTLTLSDCSGSMGMTATAYTRATN